MAAFDVKRIYAAPAPEDGARVLVDRLWPRGLTKQAAALDRWAKELAPSDALRRWFHASPQAWDEFRRRYRDELAGLGEELRAFLEHYEGRHVTLLYGAANAEERNHALLLREVLEDLAR